MDPESIATAACVVVAPVYGLEGLSWMGPIGSLSRGRFGEFQYFVQKPWFSLISATHHWSQRVIHAVLRVSCGIHETLEEQYNIGDGRRDRFRARAHAMSGCGHPGDVFGKCNF